MRWVYIRVDTKITSSRWWNPSFDGSIFPRYHVWNFLPSPFVLVIHFLAESRFPETLGKEYRKVNKYIHQWQLWLNICIQSSCNSTNLPEMKYGNWGCKRKSLESHWMPWYLTTGQRQSKGEENLIKIQTKVRNLFKIITYSRSSISRGKFQKDRAIIIIHGWAKNWTNISHGECLSKGVLKQFKQC